ncbi:putative ATP-grasp superfamily ATP-dependent carboligase [Bacillus mesophilus]|uniref:ATP-grasp domain-containing protein n=1 Tax=Bacillus mesophilus TaxID=1808955 RepID=A0A6M0Q7H0_9BACI|nr:ATP-grasp domain-containing protein [Bacillus mesophilus]MBM7661628.1 putative ATP-grasp superfamily ATP-dependent carboligase [Bacillus mesophilus]NEY72296.1 hypothetical protein [Bacillus mesophilus]
MRQTILFLDANKRYTLSMIRSIGKHKKYHILLAGESRLDLCRFSTFSEGFFLYTSPENSHQLFIESLRNIIDDTKPDFIFPSNDATLFSIYHSSLYEEIQHQLIAPDKFAYLQTLNKEQMNHLATLCNVKVIDQVGLQDDLQFPIVVKPRQSRFLVGDSMFYGFRKFVSNQEELQNALIEISQYDHQPLLQSKIDGKGFGIFAAAKDGQIFSSFAHERVREYPADGGVSTLRRSIHVHPELLASSVKIIKELNWTGILMVEFKGHSEGDAYFMEVNGRPWGSMDLAVNSGVDFPFMMVDLFINKLNIDELKSKYNKEYQINHHSKWIVGELKHMVFLLLDKQPLKKKVIELVSMIINHPKIVSYDTFSWKDPFPFIFEVLNLFKTGIVKGFKKISVLSTFHKNRILKNEVRIHDLTKKD